MGDGGGNGTSLEFFPLQRARMISVSQRSMSLKMYTHACLCRELRNYFSLPEKNLGICFVPLLHCGYWQALFLKRNITQRRGQHSLPRGN